MKDKVVIITGATGGLGKAVTRDFVAAGARVVAVSRSESKLQSLTSQLTAGEDQLVTMATDVLEETAVKALVDEVMEKFGRIDVLAHLVGGFLGGPGIDEITASQWNDMMVLNLKSTFLCCHHIFPIMQKQNAGKIVTIGAKGGIKGIAGLSAYSASKAGVINFTQSLSEEGRDSNVTANVIVPSIIDTPENRKAMPDADFDNWVKPEAIAKTILFVVSDDASDINGAVIQIYGNA